MLSQADDAITTNTTDTSLTANANAAQATTDENATDGIDNDLLTSTGTTATLASTVSLGAFGGNSANSLFASDCEYLKLVSGFKRTLVIPDAFFLNVMPLCYCNGCLAGSSNGGSSTNATLKGWVRFTINQFVTNVNHGTSSTVMSSDSNSDWTTAFYLTRVNKIRSILDHGQPMPIGKFEIVYFLCVIFAFINFILFMIRTVRRYQLPSERRFWSRCSSSSKFVTERQQ